MPIPIEEISKFPLPGLDFPSSFSFSPDGKYLTYLKSVDSSGYKALYGLDLTDKSEFLIADNLGDSSAKETLEEQLRRQRLRQMSGGISQYFWTKNSKILEIGSGHGETLIELEKLNFQTTGVEPDLKNVEHLRKTIKKSKIIQSTIENLDIDEKFDFIWMSHVFEHLSDPISFLNNIKKNMTKTYFLFIEVPSVTKKNDYRIFTIPPHAYNYSGIALQNVLKKTGYKIISCDYFGPPTKLNGGMNKISTKIFKKDYYPFYPKMLLDADTGEDIRIIAQYSGMN